MLVKLKNTGLEVLIAVVVKSSIFWDIMLCSPVKALLSASFTLISCLACCSNGNENGYSTYLETLVSLKHITQHYILEDRTLLVRKC
jgi:hypothetical protein